MTDTVNNEELRKRAEEFINNARNTPVEEQPYIKVSKGKPPYTDKDWTDNFGVPGADLKLKYPCRKDEALYNKAVIACRDITIPVKIGMDPETEKSYSKGEVITNEINIRVQLDEMYAVSEFGSDINNSVWRPGLYGIAEIRDYTTDVIIEPSFNKEDGKIDTVAVLHVRSYEKARELAEEIYNKIFSKISCCKG